MKGEEHVFYTFVSFVVILPLLLSYENLGAVTLIILLAAVFIGSLAPDADTADSAIMHGMSGGKGSSRSFRRHTVLFLPLFGYVLRYLIYYPVSVILWIVTFGKLKPKHRGLLHSLFGILATTLLMSIYLFIATMILSGVFIEYFGAVSNALSADSIQKYIVIFALGSFFGSLMHLIEDSCTHSGVCWFYPFSSLKLYGDLVSSNRRMWLICVVLGIFAVISLWSGFNLQNFMGFSNSSSLPVGIENLVSTVSIIPIIYLIAAWITCMKISGVRCGK